MGDEKYAHLMLLLQIGNQIENLFLDRYVERSGRLISDQKFRFARNRHRDHHALLLPA